MFHVCVRVAPFHEERQNLLLFSLYVFMREVVTSIPVNSKQRLKEEVEEEDLQYSGEF